MAFVGVFYHSHGKETRTHRQLDCSGGEGWQGYLDISYPNRRMEEEKLI